MPEEQEALFVPVKKLTRDMLKAIRQKGGGVTSSEARFLVDIYYTMQDQRIRLAGQVRSLVRDARTAGKPVEPHDALSWVLDQFSELEREVGKILAAYTMVHPMAWFFEQTVGIGPILSAGLLAHIDINKAPTVGHIWNYAGLNPDVKWERGKRRPWNAELKKLCWKIGDSFVKQSSHPNGVYGRVYRERKAYEWERNLKGDNAARATQILTEKNFGKDTDAKAWLSGQCSPVTAKRLIDQGKPVTAETCRVLKDSPHGVAMLPPAQIDMRARRYAVKLFLSHLHECWWRFETGTEPPKPFAIAIQGHAHYIAPTQIQPR